MARGPEGETFSAVIDKTYEDTLDLLIEARNTAAFSPPARDDRRTPMKGLAVAGPHLRVTSRLAGVMAWLLYQKAVGASPPAEGPGNAIVWYAKS